MNGSMKTLVIAGLMIAGLMAAAGVASAQMTGHDYEVTITNLTTMQVLSPPIVTSHSADTHVWQEGQLASPEVRDIAEMGDTSALAAKLMGSAADVQATMSPVPPGESVSVTVNVADGDVVSALAMLVQTNDGFTGLDGASPGMSDVTVDADAYDAGTEENTELAADVPGPPFGGTNRAPTDPAQMIAMHPGIQGMHDVGPEYGWEGPVARFTIRPMPAQLPKTGADGPSLSALLAIVGTAVFGLGAGIRLAQSRPVA